MPSKHSRLDGEGQALKRIRLHTEDSAMSTNDELDDSKSISEYESDDEIDAWVNKNARDQLNQVKSNGSIREAGAISKVVLWQFMCHRFQEVKLGPQANFIIGKNGSGKSAVLTAITLVLGAKARDTNRGTSLAAFIKQGESKAEITLHLSNRGEEAFKPETYGEEIIIQRTLSKDGSGPYKIKSADGKIISNKKEALQVILDHFMIQADNPLNVLNQDAAKKFLNASTSRQKYELFIRGTQLQQLTEEYEEINANLVMSKTLLDKKREDLPELREVARQAKRVYEEVQEASEAQAKITKLQHELAWIYVQEADQARCDAVDRLESEKQVLPKCKASIQALDEKLSMVREEIARIEAEKAARNDGLLDSRRIDLGKSLKRLYDEVKAINVEIRDADATVKRLEAELSDKEQQLEAENAKSLRNTDSSRRQVLEKIRQISGEITAGENRLDEIKGESEQSRDAGKAIEDRCKQITMQLNRIQDEMEKARYNIRQAQNAQDNRILAYGPNTSRLLQAIQCENGWSFKPIGPLGMHIGLKEKPWSSVIETVLGTSLASYVVSTPGDQQLLRRLMNRCHASAPIIRMPREIFDFSSGEPSSQHMTILRALTFDDDFVKCALINDARIEKSVLVPHRKDADAIFSGGNRRHNVDVCFTLDGCRITTNAAGSKMLINLNQSRRPPRISTGDDSFIQERRQELLDMESTIGDHQRELSAVQAEYQKHRDRLRNIKTEEAQLKGKLGRAREQKASLEEELSQSASSNVSALEEVKKDLENTRKVALNQLKELFRRKEQLGGDMSSVKVEKEAVQRQLDNSREEQEAVHQQLTQKVTEQVALNSDRQHFFHSLEKHENNVADAITGLERCESQLKEITAQAKQLCGSDEAVPTRRSKKKVIAELETLNKVIKTTEMRHGNSLEEIETGCHNAVVNFHKACNQIEEQARSLRMLKTALALRKERWLQFRIHISVRAKMKFVTHLNRRGYNGKLNFNHNTQRLDIQVNVDERQPTHVKAKETRGLSGGEKSFSTISLLLTLWDAINCPIRCLDEFDVFMDDVNRRVSLRMMIDSSRESNDVQYVFITPNALGSTPVGPETRIVKMQDPERDNNRCHS